MKTFRGKFAGAVFAPNVTPSGTTKLLHSIQVYGVGSHLIKVTLLPASHHPDNWDLQVEHFTVVHIPMQAIEQKFAQLNRSTPLYAIAHRYHLELFTFWQREVFGQLRANFAEFGPKGSSTHKVRNIVADFFQRELLLTGRSTADLGKDHSMLYWDAHDLVWK